MSDATSLYAIVTDKHAETPDICAIELRGAGGRPLPDFSAGAHVEVRLPGGQTRSYSLCNAPSDRDRYVLGVHKSRTSRGGSRAMHEALRVGDTLQLSAPRNFFALAPEADHSVLVAAGIGITPILSMAEHLSTSGASFELHYVARSRDAAAFLRRIEASRFANCLRLHLSGLALASKGASATPRASRIDPIALLPSPRENSHVYVCGPAGFMEAVLAAARQAGWAAAQLHQEHFAGSVIGAAAADSFEIKLARSGRTVAVGHEESAVQALAAAGVHVPTSCEQGVCGTCLTRVLDGEPDHRDLFLSPEEQMRNDQFLPCCSRAKTACLTLDL
ncbi:PDR/VanB family oxidoreductase [Variovorax sp. N23]|uniref:PDR/VanB family oxidoreductase n=1 Tax=Variovorax sp. N23 TaxID=2980555 RepID=UPI0021C5E4B6|nr:PDR/VanB family oxidoreductase [Variovorax sp. N23]MCU4119047.1 PDR/VanB family oxidoreductase [Variovorax sp. N23]